jgi:hydroxyacylglutathione hydrolase
MAELNIQIIPALSDNYIYLFREPESGAVAVVDPGDEEPVKATLNRLGWRLTHIIITHHHADHTAGNLSLKTAYQCPIVGPAAEAARIPGLDVQVAEGDTYKVGNVEAQVLDTPGHTLGHISFWFEDSQALFCGDTLFVMGCGRLSEGTPEQQWASLRKLRGLPNETRVFCGHEYTQANARFALSLDPANETLQARAREVDELRSSGRPTVPSTIGQEKATNPFIRCDDKKMAKAAGLAGKKPGEVFAAIRKRKDNF